MIPTGVCLRCGRERPLFARVAGGRICRACYNIDHAKTCADCGQLRAVNSRVDGGRPICSTCANERQRARREAEQRGEIVAMALAGLPTADPSALRCALTEAAQDRPRVRRLVEHLRTHPDALTQGPTSTLPVLERFVVALAKAGLPVETIHPICDRCGRRRAWRSRTETGGLCSGCHARVVPRPACGICGRTRRVDHRSSAGDPICAGCTDAARRRERFESLTEEICVAARAAGPTTTRDALTAAVVATATTVPERARLAQLLAEAPDLAMTTRRPVLVARFLSEARARGCELPAAACVDCDGPAEPLVTCGAVVRCFGCARRCPGCRREAVKEIGKPLCAVCEADPRRGECAVCGGRALLDEAGRCYRCRQRDDRRCARCDVTGARTWAAGAWQCGPCALRAAFDAEVAPPEKLPAALEPLRDAVLAGGNWRTTLAWLRKSAGGQLLGRLARNELPITHEALDKTTDRPDKSISHLRALLVSTGALPEVVDRPVETFDAFVAARLQAAAIDDGDAKVARAWIRWEVAPALRSRAETGAAMNQPLNRARANLASVIALLEKLAGSGGNLRAMTQAEVDEWFSQPGHRAWRMRPFLVWARTRRHLDSRMRLPGPPAREMRSPLEHEKRWEIARRLVTDDSIPADHRVAAALVVLYGQTMARIARLTTDDVHQDVDGSVVLVLGGNPMPVHDPFASLIGALPLRHTNGVTDRVGGGRHWLFPGRQAAIRLPG